jgi:hypothetical protein
MASFGIHLNFSYYICKGNYYKQLGKIRVKGARGTKVKVFSQGLHMTRVIPMLVYKLKFCILNTLFDITF